MSITEQPIPLPQPRCTPRLDLRFDLALEIPNGHSIPNIPASRPPDDRWQFSRLDSGGDPDAPAEDNNPAWVQAHITAQEASQAELRVLAVIDHDFEDDLRGAEAVAEGNDEPTWTVRVTFYYRR